MHETSKILPFHLRNLVVTDSTEWPSTPVYPLHIQGIFFHLVYLGGGGVEEGTTCFKFPYNETQKIMGWEVATSVDQNWQHQQAGFEVVSPLILKLVS